MAAIPLSYGNSGLANASALTLTATLEEGMVYVGDTSGISPTVSGTTITWRLPEARFLGGGAWTLFARVPDAAFGTRYPVALSVHMGGEEARLSDNAFQVQVMVARQMYLATLRR